MTRIFDSVKNAGECIQNSTDLPEEYTVIVRDHGGLTAAMATIFPKIDHPVCLRVGSFQKGRSWNTLISGILRLPLWIF